MPGPSQVLPTCCCRPWTLSGPHRLLLPSPGTPYLDFDVRYAVTTYRRLAAALPGTALHYAVKANPHPTLLAALAGSGCRFDVASPAEITAALMAGAAPGDLVYSNPVKLREHVRFAARSAWTGLSSTPPARWPRSPRPRRQRRAVPAGHLGRRVGLAAVARVRLLDR